MQFFEHKIKQIQQETESSVSIFFENHKDFKFLPGQYISLEQEINGEKIRRSYSLSSIPGEDLRIGIKAIPNGVFSNFALGLKEGDSLFLSAPEGRFVLDPVKDSSNELLAIAAGSGITPVLSMIKSTLANSSNKITLLYGNKTPEEVMYKSEIEALSQNNDRLQVHYAYSKNCGSDEYLGRIDKGFIKNKTNGLQFDDVFLCGPEGLIESSKNLFLEEGYSEDQIHFELFTSSKKEDVITSEEVEITVVLDDETHQFSAPKGMNLLEAVLNEDLDAPYSCKGGVCSSCIALVSSGKASMEKNSILTDSEIEEGLTITCQAHAETDKITLDFDEC